MQSHKSIFVLLALAVMLTACGLKGPLYLPGQDPATKPADEQVVDDDDLTVTKKKKDRVS